LGTKGREENNVAKLEGEENSKRKEDNEMVCYNKYKTKGYTNLSYKKN
jgi:hypothetical protein